MQMHQFTDRIRLVKIVLVVAAVIIAGASLLVSHSLTRDLQHEERKQDAGLGLGDSCSEPS